jgi:hypothetical protein
MRSKLTLLFSVTAALLAVPAAFAHEPGEKSLPGYESKVLSVTPALAGLKVAVVEGDDELELRNGTGKTIVIYGYNHEPYLRFGPGGIFENRHSPAAYLNEDRFGKTKIPAGVSAKAQPKWLKVGSGSTYSWHDHRIHWMSPIPPPSVQKDKGKTAHIFDWKVEANAAGKPIAIAGTLDYVPPADSGTSTAVKALIAAGAGLVLAAVAFVALRLRRRPATTAPSLE